MRDNVTLHPAFLQNALDFEAQQWAQETDLQGWVNRLSKDLPTRMMLMRIAKAMFVEGLYRGACNAKDGKHLRVALDCADIFEKAQP